MVCLVVFQPLAGKFSLRGHFSVANSQHIKNPHDFSRVQNAEIRFFFCRMLQQNLEGMMRHFTINQATTPAETRTILRTAFAAGHVVSGIRTADADAMKGLEKRGLAGLRRIAVPQDDAARQSFIRKWTQRHQKRLAAGLPTALLVLAMGSAAAQAQDAMVDLGGMADVASVEVLADGSAQVTLSNGATLIVPKGSFVIAADGSILVSAAMADSIAAAMTDTGGAAGGEVALAGGALAVAVGAAAGGGGGSSGGGIGAGTGGDTGGGVVTPPSPPAVVSSSGRVIDGYIANATVFRDLNANNIFDEGEPTVVTDATGNFSGLEGSGGVIIATGGTDISTGKPFTGQLSAPGDATVITPLTTLVQALIDQSGGTLSSSDAGAQVAQAFGLTDFDVNTTDPVASDDLAALKAGAQVAAIIAVAAAAAGEQNAAAASSAVAQSLAQAITAREGGSVTLDTQTISAALTNALGEDADIGDQAAALQDAIAAIGEAETTAGVETVQTVVQGELVDAVVAGETLPDISEAVQNTAPLRPTLTAPDIAEINAEDAAEFSLTLSGTGRSGTAINIQFGDVTIPDAVVVENGIWSFDLTEVPTDGAATLSVTATDTDTGATSLPVSGPTVTIDTTPPAAPVINAISGDDIVGFGEASIIVTGTAENGASVLVTFNDATETVVATDGAFSVTFDTPDNAGAFDVTAVATDAAGNASAIATRPITVDLTPPIEEPDAITRIGTALTLTEMEDALAAFAAEQEGLTIPEGMLRDLAGDALIYRSGQYSLTFSATVFANEDGDEIANGTVLSGTFQFGLPLSDFNDQLVNATNPSAVFQYQQNDIDGNSFDGFSIPNLRLGSPSLRMDVEPFAVGPEDEERDFIIALVGEDALNELNAAGEITSLQLWLSNVDFAQKNEETGEFFGLNGTEVSINLFRPGAVGLEAFFDDMANSNLRQLQIERFENGGDETLAEARIDSLNVSFTPGDGYVAADFVEAFNALIDVRFALNNVVEKANNGDLEIADLQALGMAFDTVAIEFAPPLLGGEQISQAAVNRVEAFLNSAPEDQQAALDILNASQEEFSNLTELLAQTSLFPIAPDGGNNGGEEDTFSTIEFVQDQDSVVRLNGEDVDLKPLIEERMGNDAPEGGVQIEIMSVGTTNQAGVALNNGQVALQVFVAFDGSPTGEDWLVILGPQGNVDTYVRGGVTQAGFLTFSNTIGDPEGVIFSVVNASLNENGLMQGNDPYYTTYRLSLNDLADLDAGELSVEQLVPEAEVLITVGPDIVANLEQGEVVLPNTVGIDIGAFGNVDSYHLVGIGTVNLAAEGDAFTINRSVFVDKDGEAESLPGRVNDAAPVVDGGRIIGVTFDVSATETIEGTTITQDSLVYYNLDDNVFGFVQTTGTTGADSLFGYGSNDLIIPLGTADAGAQPDLIFLPTAEGVSGKETIVIRVDDAFEGGRIVVNGFNVMEDEISLLDTNLPLVETFDVIGEIVANLEEFTVDPNSLQPGEFKLFAVSETDSTSTTLFAARGNELEQLATFNDVSSVDLATANVTLFNQFDLLQQLPT